MADIDSLIIDITAESHAAQTALTNLANGLQTMQSSVNGINAGNLNRLANGMRNVATAMQSISGIDKRSFAAIADKFNQLNRIDNTALIQSAQSLQQVATAFNGLNAIALNSSGNISTLVSAVSSLGNSRVERATAAMPALAVALRNLMTSLSTAPNVSQNVINMTNALANLANQGQRVSSATRGINNALNSTTRSTRTASSNFRSLASTIGKFYATYFMVIRGIKGLWSDVEKAMDYTETYNYWAVALGKIKKEYASNWQQWTDYYKEMGIDSAEAYADSFESRLKELVKKMSGNAIGDSGELILTDNIGLGLDAEALMNFQAKILGVTNSVGVLGETSINTAKALSMLSADLSSLTNEDLSTVMQNLQSGLIGQSRALYKYGIDITDATLKTTALAHGITKATSAMSQSEKMQLRILSILQQSKVAWGDQANTINSVANQYRIFQQQVSNLGRILGNLLMPIVQKVLPYINAVIIVLQRLFTILGFKLWGDSWLKDIQGGISGGAGSIGEEVEDLGNTISNTADEAKKLKKQLQGFDELNNLTTQDDSGSGAGAGLGKGFDLSMDIADALKEYEKVWNEALAKAKNKSEEIANAIIAAFNKFKQSDFYKSMEKLFTVLRDLTKLTFTWLVDFYNKFLVPVGKWVGNKVIKRMVDLFVDFYRKINWRSLTNALKTLWEALSKITINVGQGLLDFLSVIAKFAFTTIAAAINVLAKALEVFAKILLGVNPEVYYAIGVAIGFMLTAFAISQIPTIIANVGTAIATFGTKVASSIESIGAFIAMNPAILWATAFVAVLGGIIYAVEELQKSVDAFTLEAITEAMSGETAISEYADAIANDFNNIAQGFTDLQTSVDEIQDIKGGIDDTAESIRTMFSAFDNGFEVEEKLNTLVGYFRSFFEDSKAEFEKVYLMIVASTTGAFDEATNAEAKAKYDAYMEEITGMTMAKIDDFDTALGKIEEIEGKLNSGDLTNQEALTQMQEIAKQFGILSDIDVSAAASSIENFREALDFNDIFTDGKFDPEKFEEATNNMVTAYQEGTTAIKTASEDTKKIVDDWLTSLGATDEMKSFFESIYDDQEKAALEEYNTKINEFTDNFGKQLLERVPETVEKATGEYAKFEWYHKLLYPTEEGYVATTLAKWEKNTITPVISGLTDIIKKTTADETKDFSWISDGYIDMFNSGFTVAGKEIDSSTSVARTTMINNSILSLKNDWKTQMQGVLESDIIPAMTTGAESTINAFTTTIEHGGGGGSFGTFAANLSNEVANEAGTFQNIGETIGNQIVNGIADPLSNIDLGTIQISIQSPRTRLNYPRYATGGFPEDGFFYANRGELVGKFSNGKTAVANNEQIEKGIAAAVFDAIKTAGGFGGGNVNIRLEGDAKGLFRAVQEGASDYTNRTGQPAFMY